LSGSLLVRNTTEPSWRASLILALYRNRHVAQARYAQLATVRADGRPANRTVVFRGFLGDTDRLTALTDVRSAKARQLEVVPWAEACWYFPMTREQFRLGGRAVVVREDSADEAAREARRDAWRELSDDTRQSFAWPAPGEPRDPGASFAEAQADAQSPPPSFGLLILDPVEVDHLELDGNPQNRWAYRRDEDGRWTGREINP
jgi:pyridoxamine 5'-phosphate oxidase